MSRYVVGIHTLHSGKLRLFELRAVSKLDAARTAIDLVVAAEPDGEETWGPEDLAELKAIDTFEALVEYMNEDALEVLEIGES